MNKLFKIISVSILGLLLTTGVFAKTEVVYIPKNTGNPYFDSIIKGFEVGAEKYGYNFSTVAPLGTLPTVGMFTTTDEPSCPVTPRPPTTKLP